MAGQRGKVSLSSGVLGIPLIYIVLFLVVVASMCSFSCKKGEEPSVNSTMTAEAIAENAPQTQARLPRLVDLGADKCIPCKMMAPILEELKKEYAGKLQIDFIDVWKNPKAGRQYGIRVIPTQIFYDVDGKEISRHQGFMGKADILATFRKAGIDLGEK